MASSEQTIQFVPSPTSLSAKVQRPEQTILRFVPSPTSLSAKVHPLVIFNICDCFVRRPDQAERVIGTLLGSVLPDGTVHIRNSYAVPHNESSDQVALDIDYQHNMLASHLKVNPKEVMVGWFSTGFGVTGKSGLIHEFYSRETANPIHLTVDTGFRNGDATIKGFVSADLNPTLVQIEPKKRQEEEDFMGPIFVQSNKRQDHSINNNSMVKERHSPFSSADSDHFVKFQNTSEKEPKQLDTSGLNLRQGDIRQSEDNSEEFVALRETSNKFDSNKSFREKSECPLKQIHASSSFKRMDNPPNYFHRLNDTNDSLQREYSENSQPTKSLRGDGASIDHSRGMDHINSSILMGDLHQEEQRSPNTPTNDAESREDTCRSLQTGILDRDDASETSMVDSMSGTDLSPDDAVEIIGQKHFWKARRAIVNQQRVFAVQVFELHRLIKVQRLIAESPHILLEDSAYLRKPLKGAPEKRIPLDYIVKNTPMIVKHKEFSEKPDNRMESSAENAVEKTSLSSLQNGSQPSSYGPFLGNPHPTTVNSDPKMGSWGFNQPSGHQWLVPVMTPFEGLVYKPYPGPGFMGPVYGHPGSTPIMGNYLNYGVPVPHHPCEGHGTASFAPPAGHGYFPPFGMPVMQPSFAGSADHTDHFNMPYQASRNVPSQKKNGAVPNAVKLTPSTDSEVQVSTASSTSNQRTRRTKVAHTSEGRNALPLFPTSPVVNVPDGGVEQPTRVIKVVPHNARSATESVARIFQSIQEERKQYDSV